MGLELLAGVTKTVGDVSGAFFNAQVAHNNAEIERQNAQNATAAGLQQADTTSRKGASNLAKIKTGIAANGVDVNTGSAVDVQASARGENELDTENVFHNAQLQAYGYRTQAANFDAQASQDRAGGIFKGAGDILSTASSLSTKWMSMAGGTPDAGDS
jgi:hypothetical protein